MRTKESYQSALYQTQQDAVFDEVDYALYQEKATTLLGTFHDEISQQQWAVFCKHLNALNDKKAEKFLLQDVVLRCFSNAVSSMELAQFISLAGYFKSAYGVGLYRKLFEAKVPDSKRSLQDYLLVLQLLVDLQDLRGVSTLVDKYLPDLQALFQALQVKQDEYLAARYPKRDIDSVLEHFATVDEITLNPLPKEVLAPFKIDYLAIESTRNDLKALTQDNLKTLFLAAAKQARATGDRGAKQTMVAIMVETVRRLYKISPYDTQIISLLALLGQDEESKGRIAQIKTGEGKSTILAMLAAFQAAQGNFVDVITSSGYLAARDCEKYTPFFAALGLSASHISHPTPVQEHFHAQILFGTNADFEFARLKDGLNKHKLCYSYPLGETTLKPRPCDVALIDEVDNMLLDTTGAARIAIPGRESMPWIYHPILNFVVSRLKTGRINQAIIEQLKTYLRAELKDTKQLEETLSLSDAKFARWLKSAQVACYQKKEDRDYLVKDDIQIVDYANTGRISEGCQWQHGIYQFLQAKHGLPIKPESLTGASISHPTYFNLFKKVFGLTGTVGEAIEREEVQQIYGIKSFDVPPHFPSQRKTLPPRILKDMAAQSTAIYERILEMQAAGRPTLVLFESINESKVFSNFLQSKGIGHQLLNETQRESEDYIIARAGQASMVTIATNMAGRGTDIILSPESKEAGGLHLISAFYPDNLRVEGQGDGRSGRQGEPGSCEKILHKGDLRICALLSNILMDVRILNWLALKSSEEEINFLNQLRSEKIQTESNERRYAAKLEALFYTCLNEFFGKLQSVYDVLDVATIREELLSICQTGSGSLSNDLLTINENSPNWFALYRSARVLIANQAEGKTVDWSSFIEQYKQAFVEYLLENWGKFYSKITDEVHGMDIALAEKTIKDSFDALNLPAKFTSEAALSGLNYLLYKAKANEISPIPDASSFLKELKSIPVQPLKQLCLSYVAENIGFYSAKNRIEVLSSKLQEELDNAIKASVPSTSKG